MGMHSQIPVDPGTWGCIHIFWHTPAYGDAVLKSTPMCWGIPVHGDAFPCNCVLEHIAMQSHVLGSPSTWECIPMSWLTPVDGDACPYTCGPRYMGSNYKIPGIPSIYECIPTFLRICAQWNPILHFSSFQAQNISAQPF
jgi:hypothetical protein